MIALDNPHINTISNVTFPGQEQRSAYFSYPLENAGDYSFTMPFSFKVEQVSAFQTIDNFGKLDEGWDGYGASRINQLTCRNARQFLNTLPNDHPFPELTPNPNGTISMDWETEYGNACLEIGKTRYSFYIKQHFGKPILRDREAREMGRDIADLIKITLYPAPHYATTLTRIVYDASMHA